VFYDDESRSKYLTTLRSHIAEDFSGAFFRFVGGSWVFKIGLMATNNVARVLSTSIVFEIRTIAFTVSDTMVAGILFRILQNFDHLARTFFGFLRSARVGNVGLVATNLVGSFRHDVYRMSLPPRRGFIRRIFRISRRSLVYDGK